MNAILGWALAVLLVFMAWQSYGMQGALFAVSAVIFWLLLQFSRALRAMKNAAGSPVGEVESAVMLNARLTRGMTMQQVLALTRALGRKRSEAPERWNWRDAGGASVTIVLKDGQVDSWTLERSDVMPA